MTRGNSQEGAASAPETQSPSGTVGASASVPGPSSGRNGTAGTSGKSKGSMGISANVAKLLQLIENAQLEGASWKDTHFDQATLLQMGTLVEQHMGTRDRSSDNLSMIESAVNARLQPRGVEAMPVQPSKQLNIDRLKDMVRWCSAEDIPFHGISGMDPNSAVDKARRRADAERAASLKSGSGAKSAASSVIGEWVRDQAHRTTDALDGSELPFESTGPQVRFSAPQPATGGAGRAMQSRVPQQRMGSMQRGLRGGVPAPPFDLRATLGRRQAPHLQAQHGVYHDPYSCVEEQEGSYEYSGAADWRGATLGPPTTNMSLALKMHADQSYGGRVHPLLFNHTAGYRTDIARDTSRMLGDVYDDAVQNLGEEVCAFSFMDKLVRVTQMLELVDSGVDQTLANGLYSGFNSLAAMDLPRLTAMSKVQKTLGAMGGSNKAGGAALGVSSGHGGKVTGADKK